MSPSSKQFAHAIAFVLTGMQKLLFAIGGLSFLVSGGLLHAETGMDRFTAEAIGLGIAAACLLLGILAKALADIIDRKDESLSIRSLPKS